MTDDGALPSWLARAGDDFVISVHVQPGAKKTEVVGAHGDALKIRLQAPPVDGKANALLIQFLAARCGVKRAEVALLTGETSRDKRVRVRGATLNTMLSLALQ